MSKCCSHNNKTNKKCDNLLVESMKKDDIKSFINLLRDETSKECNIERSLDMILKHNYKDNTLLHEAIYWSSPRILNLLLKNNCHKTLEKRNKDGNTPLNLATLKQLDWVVDTILTHYNDYDSLKSNNNHGDTPFLSAIRTGSITLVNLYLNENSDLIHDKNYITKFNSLHVAVTTPNKKFNIVKLLIEKYIPYGWTHDFAEYLIDKKNKKDTNEDISTTTSLDDYTTFSPFTSTEPNGTKSSILNDLNKQPKNPLNLEIQTYIIRKLYTEYDSDKLNDILTNHPEYAAYEKCANDNIDINMVYDKSEKDTYINRNPSAIKVLPKNLKPHFSK